MNGTLALRRLATRLGEVGYVRKGAGPPLVLLHGNGHAWHEFEPVLDALAERFDVVAWDMPGHGASDDLAGPPTIAGYAGALGDLIDGLALDRPALAGTSVGAMIALACANARSDIRRVVLAEVQYRTRGWWDAAWPRVELMFGQPVQDREQVQQRFVSPVSDALVARWNADRSRVGAAGLIAVMEAIRGFDVIGGLAGLRTQGLLLFGDVGPTVDMASDVRAALPALGVEVVGGAGHFITVDQPAAFARVVSDFLAAPSGPRTQVEFTPGLRVRVDRGRCVCSETCARLAPATFETDEAGLVSLLPGPFDAEAAVRAAAAGCPASAIIVEHVGADR